MFREFEETFQAQEMGAPRRREFAEEIIALDRIPEGWLKWTHLLRR